ncbi:hypothetical protein HBA55_31990 [Pseudomaricurvus alkylphenolicus]|jgi:uncharacterized membrane protein YgcG|uniref:hypothetical protein n=1 Tax=Pseudomaricurvus alkylphenolicus TaxID=1306991 RepID=UPI001423CE82|nr:hypothetical protein [Pseudomaricurvus alkylphenolicus]NIB44265.1 hypothetical protein [Pseudomaricurvus alkylphenolicus]
MKLTTLIWLVVGITSLLNTDLESLHWFDGVLLPVVDFAFIVWLLSRLTLARAGGSGGSGGWGSGGWGDGGGGDCGSGGGGDGGGC